MRGWIVVLGEFARTIARMKPEGRDVVMMTGHPGDDRWAIEIMRKAGHPDLAYIAGYEDLDATLLLLLVSADLVIGERLHAVVLAAAMGTPFVAVEYRPKVRDFARSVNMNGFVVRTDEISGLGEMIRTVSDSHLEETWRSMPRAVERLRRAQSRGVSELRAMFGEGVGRSAR